ncbi:MAG: hypothetical protein JNL94_18680, partial [Planctomycetes bacterium]|nr:hypothetical protein [Planctomycetota bacterium]
MLRFGTVVRTLGFVLGCSMFAIVFAVLPGCDEFGEPDPPPTGTYRFVTLDRQYGQPIAVSPSGLVAWFRIDYRGPKSWLEIVIENRIDDALVGTEVLLRRQFGIDDFVKSDDASWSVVREPFTKTGQMLSLTLVDLPEVLRDGRTTLATVAIS